MKADWNFIYDEEHWDYAGANFAGVMQDKNNPSRVLFFHAYKDLDDDPIEICYVYSSIFMDDDSLECMYPWTADNDSLLLKALNESGDNYCGDGSPIQKLEFNESE